MRVCEGGGCRGGGLAPPLATTPCSDCSRIQQGTGNAQPLSRPLFPHLQNNGRARSCLRQSPQAPAGGVLTLFFSVAWRERSCPSAWSSQQNTKQHNSLSEAPEVVPSAGHRNFTPALSLLGNGSKLQDRGMAYCSNIITIKFMTILTIKVTVPKLLCAFCTSLTKLPQ